MWRANGAGELYTYLPLGDTNINACKASGSKAVCDNEVYGLSFGRGEFTWPSGQWATVQERVRLNDVGSNNGQSTGPPGPPSTPVHFSPVLTTLSTSAP